MAVSECRQYIKDKLSGLNVYDLDKNEITEPGVFLLYEGFDKKNESIFRTFGIYVAGISYDQTFDLDAVTTQIEDAFTGGTKMSRRVEIAGGKLVSFSSAGFLIFRIPAEIQEI